MKCKYCKQPIEPLKGGVYYSAITPIRDNGGVWYLNCQAMNFEKGHQPLTKEENIARILEKI